MAVASYPSQLPTPQAMTLSPAERRQLSAPDLPREARALERERRRLERIVFPPMDATQAAIFRAWWHEDLLDGGAWFAASWPTMAGVAEVVRKFVGAPTWSFIPGGRWRISAMCETRDGPPVVRPSPEIVGISASSKNINAFNATLPSGETGDLLLLFSVAYNQETSPSGYELVATQVAGVTNLRNKLFARVATGFDTAALPSIAWQQAIVVRLRGADLDNIVVQEAIATNPSPSELTPAPMSMSAGDYLVLVMASAMQPSDLSSFSFSPTPSDLTITQGWTSDQRIEPIAAVGWRELTAASSYTPQVWGGTRTFNYTNSFTVRFRL